MNCLAWPIDDDWATKARAVEERILEHAGELR